MWVFKGILLLSEMSWKQTITFIKVVSMLKLDVTVDSLTMDPNNPPVELYPCSIISSQEVFIRMKWDKVIVKDAALEHLFLSSKVLEPKLPTAWLVHTVSVVFASGKLHLLSIKIRFG